MEAALSVKTLATTAGLGLGLLLAALAPVRAGTPMPTGAAVMPPGGFIFFCVKHLQDCSGLAQPVVVELTSARREQLDAVQSRVNAAIEWRDDPAHVWDYPTAGYGDCNKFALEKRRELIAMGWPRQALLLTTAFTERGEGHLVLVARTSDGDLVLDNRLARVVDWSRLPYRWVAQQNPASPAEWVAVGSAPLATADAGTGRVATP